MVPVVGISQCLDGRGRWRAGRSTLYLDCAYARAIEAAGGLPIHLPVQRDAPALVDRIDGLLIPGGDDFAPPPERRYPDPGVFDPAPDEQIAFDRALLEAAEARDLPVLGICYGMQLMALHRDGALHYHLPEDAPDAGCHRLDADGARHALEIEPESRLAAVLGAGPVAVNSHHHQAVATPGRGMRAVARSADGVVEAIEDERAAFAVGVQWHPEKLPAEEARPLFAAFVAACRPSAQRRASAPVP